MSKKPNPEQQNVITRTTKSNLPSSLMKELIDLVNLVPPDVKLPSKDEIFSELDLGILESLDSKEEVNEHFRKLHRAKKRIYEILDPYPELIEILKNEKKSSFFDDSSRLSAHRAYSKFLTYRQLLRRAAEGVANLEKFGYVKKISGVFDEDFEINEIVFDPEELSMNLFTLSVGNDGKFSFWFSPFIEAFSPDQEARRLAICPVCDRIYWKYRTNAQACSKECSAGHRFKKWLSKPENKEQFLRNKKAKYYQNKQGDRFPSRVKKELE